MQFSSPEQRQPGSKSKVVGLLGHGLFTALLLYGCSNTNKLKEPEPQEEGSSRAIDSSPPIPAEPTFTPSKRTVANTKDGGVSKSENPQGEAKELATKLSLLRNSRIVGLSLLSTRSLTLKLHFPGGKSAVFKPILKGDRRALREVAAFRVAKMLHIGQVPPSTLRQVKFELPVSLLEKKWPEESNRLKETAALEHGQKMLGAIISWVDDIDKMKSEEICTRRNIRTWLELKRPLDTETSLARDASNMVTFDYLIGNWDRFSGGNFFVSRSRKHLILLDHNSAFASLSTIQSDRMERFLTNIERFSKSLIYHLRKLTKSEINEHLAKEPWHGRVPLLKERDVTELLMRRDSLIRHIDQLIKTKGEDTVLAFE
jgi:hypothetical protein